MDHASKNDERRGVDGVRIDFIFLFKLNMKKFILFIYKYFYQLIYLKSFNNYHIT